MRHAATRAVLERDGVIIVASVSCIYGIGSVETYTAMTFSLQVGEKVDQRQIIADLEGPLDAGLLRERADLAVSGAIGRPRVPVEVNHEPFLTLGIHIGARTTSIVATDLFGRTLDAVENPTPRSAQGPALGALAGQVLLHVPDGFGHRHPLLLPRRPDRELNHSLG